jgi:hypothetical protein
MLSCLWSFWELRRRMRVRGIRSVRWGLEEELRARMELRRGKQTATNTADNDNDNNQEVVRRLVGPQLTLRVRGLKEQGFKRDNIDRVSEKHSWFDELSEISCTFQACM